MLCELTTAAALHHLAQDCTASGEHAALADGCAAHDTLAEELWRQRVVEPVASLWRLNQGKVQRERIRSNVQRLQLSPLEEALSDELVRQGGDALLSQGCERHSSLFARERGCERGHLVRYQTRAEPGNVVMQQEPWRHTNVSPGVRQVWTVGSGV
eukprot:5979773-Prymnesium_polylepis.2